MARHKKVREGSTVLANRYVVTSLSLGAMIGIGAAAAAPASAAQSRTCSLGTGPICSFQDFLDGFGHQRHYDSHIGANQNVNFANSAGQDVYVLPALRPGYLVADMGVDIGLMALGIGEIKAAYKGAAALPETIKTVSDMYKYLKVSGMYLSGTAATGFRSAEASVAGVEAVTETQRHAAQKFQTQFLEAVKGSAIKIPDGESKNVRDQGFFSTWTNPVSGMGGMSGLNTLSFIVVTGDGKKVSEFNGAPDNSWIVNSDGIVRSKYGSLWQPDPYAGQHSWGAQAEDNAQEGSAESTQGKPAENTQGNSAGNVQGNSVQTKYQAMADKILNREAEFEKEIDQDYGKRIEQASSAAEKEKLAELKQQELSLLHQMTDGRIPEGARQDWQQRHQQTGSSPSAGNGGGGGAQSGLSHLKSDDLGAVQEPSGAKSTADTVLGGGSVGDSGAGGARHDESRAKRDAGFSPASEVSQGGNNEGVPLSGNPSRPTQHAGGEDGQKPGVPSDMGDGLTGTADGGAGGAHKAPAAGAAGFTADGPASTGNSTVAGLPSATSTGGADSKAGGGKQGEPDYRALYNSKNIPGSAADLPIADPGEFGVNSGPTPHPATTPPATPAPAADLAPAPAVVQAQQAAPAAETPVSTESVSVNAQQPAAPGVAPAPVEAPAPVLAESAPQQDLSQAVSPTPAASAPVESVPMPVEQQYQ